MRKFLQAILPKDFYLTEYIKASHALIILIIIGLVIITFKSDSSGEMINSIYLFLKGVGIVVFLVAIIIILPRMS